MSAFTDDDLMRLREHLGLGGYADERTSFDVKALVARLEAGEAALRDYKGDAEETVLYAKWRKSCGR